MLTFFQVKLLRGLLRRMVARPALLNMMLDFAKSFTTLVGFVKSVTTLAKQLRPYRSLVCPPSRRKNDKKQRKKHKVLQEKTGF